MVTFHTAGESHGKAEIVIINGIPAGLQVDIDFLNRELFRRQQGYGRGGRMKIETDTADILAGVRHKLSLGSPICILIENKDYKNWKNTMAPTDMGEQTEKITIPRPGHADLVGLQKFGHNDIRNVIERSSARETCARVAAGAICKMFLREFGVTIFSYTVGIGKAHISRDLLAFDDESISNIEKSCVRTPDPVAEKEMIVLIDNAQEKGDTLGGLFRVIATGVPPGLGSYNNWDDRLDGEIARAVTSIPSVKGIEIGNAFNSSSLFGSEVHDAIVNPAKRDGSLTRASNNAGGLKGGVTNGMPVVITAAVKPISTLGKGLQTIDLKTGEEVSARYERSDVCVVPAAGVIGESMLAFVLAGAFIKKFGSDCMRDIKQNYNNYMKRLKTI